MSPPQFHHKVNRVHCNNNPDPADGPDFVDPVVNWALNYLGHFDLSNRLLTHLKQSPIKHKVLDIKWKEFNFGFKFKNKYAEFNVSPKQNQLSPNRVPNGHVWSAQSMSALLYLTLHAHKVRPIAHLKWDVQ